MKIKSSGIYVKAKGTEISNFQTKGSLLFFCEEKRILLGNIKSSQKCQPPLTELKNYYEKNLLKCENNSSRLVYDGFHAGILVNILS